MIFEVGTHDFYEDYVSSTSGTSAIVNGAGCGYGNYGTLIKSIHLNTAIVPNVYDENWTDSAQSQILINEPANQPYFNHPVITYGFNKDLGDNVKRIITKTDGKYGCKISADHKIAYPNETVNLSASGYGPFNFDSFTIDGATLTGSAFDVNNSNVYVTANFTGNSFVYSGSTPVITYFEKDQNTMLLNIGLNISNNVLQNHKTIFTSYVDESYYQRTAYNITPNTGYMLALKNNEYAYNVMFSANVDFRFSSDDAGNKQGYTDVMPYLVKSTTSTSNIYTGQSINLYYYHGALIPNASGKEIHLTNENSAASSTCVYYADKFTDFSFLKLKLHPRPVVIGEANPSKNVTATVNYIVSGYI